MNRAIKWNFQRFKTLYDDGASQWAIAREFGTTQHAVWRRIKALGLTRPNRAGIVRTCQCGLPVHKRRDNRRDKDGFPILTGTRCLECQRAYERIKATRWRLKHPGRQTEISRSFRLRQKLHERNT